MVLLSSRSRGRAVKVSNLVWTGRPLGRGSPRAAHTNNSTPRTATDGEARCAGRCVSAFPGGDERHSRTASAGGAVFNPRQRAGSECCSLASNKRLDSMYNIDPIQSARRAHDITSDEPFRLGKSTHCGPFVVPRWELLLAKGRTSPSFLARSITGAFDDHEKRCRDRVPPGAL